VILVSKTPLAFEELWRRVERGATAVFLSPDVLKKGDQPLGWLPLANQGTATPIRGWLYLKDEWAKRHPIFDGLPSGGLMDYTFYREIIPDTVLIGQDPPTEAVAGAIKASQDYSSGLMLAVYESGAGRFILNTLLIRENLGTHPAAEHLLRNLLNRFCRRFITQDPRDSGAKFYDPKGRQYDQMTAAQSGPGSGHGASEQDSFWCPAANGVDPCLGITPSIPARFHAE
jgi:hypothetical protein